MRLPTTILLGLITLSLSAQEKEGAFDGHNWQAPYVLPTPKDWGIERFPIPISFAPEIAYKGVEDIRFSPGWAKSQSEEYWSYAFLWYLEGAVEMDSKKLENNLSAYYTGLVRVNGSKIPTDKLIPVVTEFQETTKGQGDLGSYAGTIVMTDYMTHKSIVLNSKVHVKSCAGSNKTFIFYELSPQPFSHATWHRLDQLWLDFKCPKN